MEVVGELIEEYRRFEIYKVDPPRDYPDYGIYIKDFWAPFGGQYCTTVEMARLEIDGVYGYSKSEG